MSDQINLNEFKFKYPIHMRWNDLDSLGHVNNALYVTYFEGARGPFMVTACEGWDWTKHMFLIAKIEVNLRKELTLQTQQPEVWMRTKEIGNKSFVLEYAIVSQKGGEHVIHASGTTTQVMFDMKTRTTVPIEDWIRDGLTNHLS